MTTVGYYADFINNVVEIDLLTLKHIHNILFRRREKQATEQYVHCEPIIVNSK